MAGLGLVITIALGVASGLCVFYLVAMFFSIVLDLLTE